MSIIDLCDAFLRGKHCILTIATKKSLNNSFINVKHAYNVVLDVCD